MIRIFQQGDHVSIAEIFVSSIYEIASEVYSEEQCLAWSDPNPNYEHWRKRCEFMRPFVSVHNSEISGFLELDHDGHIGCAYVNPRFKRSGIITLLAEHAVRTAFAFGKPVVSVDASTCAKPLFEKIGFTVTKPILVNFSGVELPNFTMTRYKTAEQGAAANP